MDAGLLEFWMVEMPDFYKKKPDFRICSLYLYYPYILYTNLQKPLQVGFTIIFNLEALLKMIGLTWKGYIRRGQHKFELILCGGSTLNAIPPLYGTNVFTYFQVFRILRLIKASPMLEDFLYKVRKWES